MTESELIFLMKISGFNNNDMKKIHKLSKINLTTIDNVLYKLSSMYFKLFRAHAAVAIAAGVFLIIGYDEMDFKLFLSIALAFILGNLALRRTGSVILAFKAHRLLKQLGK